VDLICDDGRSLVVVEVRVRSTSGDPIDAVDPRKRRQVASLASRLGADRVDLIGVGIHRSGVDVHWVPGAV
jgi:Holliday junction resolvase-like predicted endonuclease